MTDRPSEPSPTVGQKRVEEELRRREADLSIAQTLAGLGGWEWNLTTGKVTWSPEMIALVRPAGGAPTSVDEVMKFVGPEHEAAIREAAEAAITTGEPFDVETPLQLEDGRMVHLHSRARVVRDEDGGAIRLVGMSQDISERRRSETALRHSEARYRALMQQIDDVIYSVDREGRITTISGAFTRATGFAAEEWIGRKFTDLLNEESIDRAQRTFMERLTNQEPGRDEYLINGRDSTITVEVGNAPFFVDGELAGIVGVARDVTASRIAQKEADRERRLASLGNLAGSAAHEFNNVLMSVLPYAELLRRLFPDDDRVRNATEHMTTAVRRGRHISQQILRLSRPANPTLASLDIADWLRFFSLDAGASLGPRYHLSVSNECPGACVVGDRALIDQVATNLLANARESMPDGGEIEFRVWRPQPEQIALSMTDHGEGIAPEQVEHVFDPLFTTRHGSTGLGLTVAHQAMSLQNGTLRVESREGSGSTFTMVFREAPAAKPSSEPSRATTPTRVLLVEDEESIAHGVAMLLESEGMIVRIASRGSEVMPSIDDFGPDVAVLDVSLPDANGLELFEGIRERWPRLAVVFSTGHRDAPTVAALNERKLPSVTKPYDVEELIAIIRSSIAIQPPE